MSPRRPDLISQLAVIAIAANVGCSSTDGEPATPISISIERSLVWTQPEIVDQPDTIGLGRLMATIADDQHGGAAFVEWLETFSVTSHSERLGPALLIEELRDELGDDPTSWDLDSLPFTVTAVHNRIDLGPKNGECGELRVSLASTHPVYAPFHIIFLFRQPLIDGDGEVKGALCRESAARWARLSEINGIDFVDAAETLLDELIVADGFLLAESVELTVSPWEWRQWRGISNPPLFQTVDIERANEPGAFRDDFLAYAEQHANGLAQRNEVIPAQFRPQSIRVPPFGDGLRLILNLPEYPQLERNIEILGCPGCHTFNAEFVHTSPQREFSPFYEDELEARSAWLDDLANGKPVAVPPYGPLQEL